VRQWAEIGDVQTWIASNLHSDTFQKKNMTTEWYLIVAAFLGFNDPKKNDIKQDHLLQIKDTSQSRITK
jgi:hypothetical protein